MYYCRPWHAPTKDITSYVRVTGIITGGGSCKEVDTTAPHEFNRHARVEANLNSPVVWYVLWSIAGIAGVLLLNAFCLLEAN